jgi:hypothetical protein
MSKLIHCGPLKGQSPESLIRKCLICDVTIPRKGSWAIYLKRLFCSAVCMGKWNVGQNSSQWKQRENKPCLRCGRIILFPIDRSPANRPKKFCSLECRRLYGKPNNYRPWNGYVVLGYDRDLGTIFEHIAKAECALRRPLRKGEVVHHVNLDRSDNSPGNLVICTRSYHTWIHQEMSRRYALEHFRRDNLQLHVAVAS